MKKFFIFLFAFLLVIPFVFAKEKLEIIKVYDGDTVLAKIDQNIFRIRLIGIDCFEGLPSDRAKRQAKEFNLTLDEIVSGGNKAKVILENELKNKKATFSFKGIDKYNRALGVLYVNNININQKMLKTPYCKPYIYIPSENN